MKSLIFTVLTLSVFTASALDEVSFDQNDTYPQDYLRYQQEIRTKIVPHKNGLNYAVMYTSQNNGTAQSTQIVAMCNIGYKDHFDRCSQDRDPVLGEVYAALVQKSKADCAKIALLSNDHMTTLSRHSDYQNTASRRNPESNVRALSPIVASLLWQVETLNTHVPSVNMAQNIANTKKLSDDVANKMMPPEHAKYYLEQQSALLKKDFITLVAASRCTNEDLRLCRFNSQSGELLTPETSQENYAKYMEIERLGLVEMRACSTAKAVTAPAEKQGPPAPPVIKEPTITLPAIRSVEPQPEEAQAIDPTTAGK